MSTIAQRKIPEAGEEGERGLGPEGLEAVAGLFKVFSEPTRLALLQELKAGPRSVGELVEVLGMAQANVSRQLRIMSDARLLGREKRGNQVIYSLDEEMVLPLCDLVCGKVTRDAQTAREGSPRVTFGG